MPAIVCLSRQPKLLATAIVDGQGFATLLDQRLKRFLIEGSRDFDHYPTGRDLAILVPLLAVKLRERCQWLESGTVSGVLVGAPFAALNVG